MKQSYLVLACIALLGFGAWPAANKLQMLWQTYQLNIAIASIKQHYRHPVILFGDQKCRFCAQARDFLDTKKVPYLDLDVSQTGRPADKAAYQTLNEKGIPVILIGDTLISGFDAKRIVAALAEHAVSE
jgi:glutaredoxin